MDYSPSTELFSVLTSSFQTGSLFLFITAIPWVATGVVRYFKGACHVISRAFLWSAGFTTLVALAGLLTLPPPAGMSPLAVWMVVYLYGFVPLWLTIALALMLLLWLIPRTSEEESDDERL